MNSKIFMITVLAASLTAMTVGIWAKATSRKVAYVKAAVLVDQYLGMKEAKILYQNKVNGWQSDLQQLENEYMETEKMLQSTYKSLNKEELEREQTKLSRKGDKIMEFRESIEAKAKEEDEKMTESVLNQINSFVEEYAKREGIDLVLGTTLSGNILYGVTEMDITEELIEELNKNYKGAK